MPILTWLTREEDVDATKRVAYRLLEEVHELSIGDGKFGNMLIQGNNLDALKALMPFYAGRIKCVYIDPPYNTRSAFEHYDDNLEHTRWLAMMWPRLELLRELLAEDGSIWISIDDNEGHYLKVMMDEVFGRMNFIDTIIWRKNYSPKSSAVTFLRIMTISWFFRRMPTLSSRISCLGRKSRIGRTRTAITIHAVRGRPAIYPSETSMVSESIR